MAHGNGLRYMCTAHAKNIAHVLGEFSFDDVIRIALCIILLWWHTQNTTIITYLTWWYKVMLASVCVQSHLHFEEISYSVLTLSVHQIFTLREATL